MSEHLFSCGLILGMIFWALVLAGAAAGLVLGIVLSL